MGNEWKCPILLKRNLLINKMGRHVLILQLLINALTIQTKHTGNVYHKKGRFKIEAAFKLFTLALLFQEIRNFNVCEA